MRGETAVFRRKARGPGGMFGPGLQADQRVRGRDPGPGDLGSGAAEQAQALQGQRERRGLQPGEGLMRRLQRRFGDLAQEDQRQVHQRRLHPARQRQEELLHGQGRADVVGQVQPEEGADHRPAPTAAAPRSRS